MRRALLAAALLAVAVSAGALWGFLVAQGGGPPYRQLDQLAGRVRAVLDELPGEEERAQAGRFRGARGGALGPVGPEAERIAQLRALGYLQGSEPAAGESGVSRHDAAAAPGWNLANDGHAPEAVLFDMDGRERHRWSLPYERAFPGSEAPAEAVGTRYWRRVRLLPDGELLAIYEGNGLVRVDRDSRLRWAWDGWAHHDLDVADSGRIYVLSREAELLPRYNSEQPILHDFIAILDPDDGALIRKISLLEAFENSDYAPLLARVAKPVAEDLLHSNSLEILDGSLASRIPAFRAGNALVSLRNLDAVAVVDVRRGRVVWALAGISSAQHDPTVLPNGHLLLFDNLGDRGASRVLELDPVSQRVAWAYRGSEHDFWSRTCGTSQRLPGGTTLITESDNGRAFEVTADGRTVWEYRTPHRAGDRDELVATLFEVRRLPPGDPRLAPFEGGD